MLHLLALLTAFLPQQEILPESPARDLKNRQDAVQEKLGKDGILILRSSLYRNRFQINKNYYYLTSTTETDHILVLTGKESILYLPPRNEGNERWETKKLYPGKEAAAKTGVEDTRDLDRFDKDYPELMKDKGRLYLHCSDENDPDTVRWIRAFSQANWRHPDISIKDAGRLLAAFRLIKTDREIALLQKAIDITGDAQIAAMKSAKPGINERELQATIEYTFKKQGGTGIGFPSIIGSGINSCILHYDKNERKTKDGDLVVMDIGAEYGIYTADVTRTIPVNGKFTERQKAVYNLVLKAQTEAMNIIKPGIKRGEVHQKAVEVVKEGLVELGLIEDPKDYFDYFMHGTSHWLGLDVHDVGNRDTELQAGMVFTVEPGIYIDKEEIGIRIEDDVLVTDTGYQLLSGKAPRTVEEIETLMASD